MAKEPESTVPLLDRASPREREALLSLLRYFEWANDLRRLHHRLSRESPSGVPYLSYYYGTLCVVIEGWRHLKRQRPDYYRDGEIDALLESPLVGHLELHRDQVFHFTPKHSEDGRIDFVNLVDFEGWTNQIHGAFERWLVGLGVTLAVFHLEMQHEQSAKIGQ